MPRAESHSFPCAECLALLLGVVPATAQTGRTVALGTPPDLGALSSYTARYPLSAAGRLGAYGMTLPFAGAVALVLPGFTSSGLVRIDLANILLQGLWVLDGTGAHMWTTPVPMAPAFQGLSFDVQTLDVDLGAIDVAWGDNDLALTVGQGAIGLGHNMVWIPAGTFSMGSSATPLLQGPYYNTGAEQPVHAVTITHPFWIGKYEVTQGEYLTVMGTNPSLFVGSRRLPVEQVSWYDAMAYCAALTASEGAAGRVPSGYQYRLPTEAEWEYCYRAGTTTEFWRGQTIACSDAHFTYSYHNNSWCGPGPAMPLNSTAVVGSYPANPWGLHDVAGNVREWCLDSWDLSANYPATTVADPFVTSGIYRITRGGAWSSRSFQCRAAEREFEYPLLGYLYVGFRVVLAPKRVP